jgi:hypothetical protein
MIRNFRVNFFKREEEKDDKGVVIGKTYSHLGSVTVDDSNIGEKLTLASKAFRHASEKCAQADRVEIRELK